MQKKNSIDNESFLHQVHGIIFNSKESLQNYQSHPSENANQTYEFKNYYGLQGTGW